MINVNYQKRKNQELFKSLENPNTTFLSSAQNYIPIYKRFFALNETNYNNINLNHFLYLTSVIERAKEDEYSNTYSCRISKLTGIGNIKKNVFFKMAPLLDPFKYLVGKYDVTDKRIMTLPSLNSTTDDCHSKIIDPNNSAYVDGLFIFLLDNLLENHNFIHGLKYYGSF